MALKAVGNPAIGSAIAPRVGHVVDAHDVCQIEGFIRLRISPSDRCSEILAFGGGDRVEDVGAMASRTLILSSVETCISAAMWPIKSAFGERTSSRGSLDSWWRAASPPVINLILPWRWQPRSEFFEVPKNTNAKFVRETVGYGGVAGG